MDLQEHPELICGEEFCFPATTTYYPPRYGFYVPDQLYQHQTISRCNDQASNCTGHQARGTSGMYYSVPGYGIVHSPHGPHPLHPSAIGDGKQDPSYHSQSLANTNRLFVPGGLQHTVAAASGSGVAWNQSIQQATVSSMEFQGHTFLPKKQPCRLDPWKRQFSGGAMLPARLPCARQSSLQTNLPYNNEVPSVGSAEKTYARTGSNSYRRLSSVGQKNISKAKMPIGSMSSEIIVKSYTSRLDVGNPEGSIVIRTDEYNRNDFQVSYPNAKFFVIKPINEADVHKSIKYGVWSTSSTGNKKLDSAFREAQVIAASSCTLCPVFLFFSVNGNSRFYGVAEMVGPVNLEKDMDFWSKDIWIGSFPVKWHIIKDICNSTLRSMMLQNNEDKPITSKDPQEVDYICGTTMLEIFKYTRAEKCLLDKFMIHDDDEAKNLQRRRFKLRRGAQHFVRVRPTKSTPDSLLMYRAIRETDHLKDELEHLDLEGHEAQTSNMKLASDEEHHCKKVEITPSGEIHSDKNASATPDMTHEG